MNLLKSCILQYSLNCENPANMNNRINTEMMKKIIIEHQHVLSIVRKIDSIYNYISFVQIVFSNMIICVTGFVMITASI